MTAVTTESGQVTIMMPHPERVFRTVSNSLASGKLRQGWPMDAHFPQCT
ncbi:phosphoribosylformylglycinamidine synthase subunit PurQ [Escherichia coli]